MKTPTQVLFSVMSAAAVLNIHFDVVVRNEPGTLGERFSLSLDGYKHGYCGSQICSTGFVEMSLDEAITLLVNYPRLKARASCIVDSTVHTPESMACPKQ